MEEQSGYVIHVEILDKRHVGMKSRAMEKKVLQNSITDFQNSFTIVEVFTDASSTIKKLMGNYSK